MPSEDDLNVNVSESSSYKSHTQGPASDTHAFHNATPAPGERTVFDSKAPPPTRRASLAAESNSNLPKIAIRKRDEEEVKESMDDNLTVPVVATGAVIFLFAMLAGLLALGMLIFGQGDEEPVPEPVVEEVEGIPVRKELK